MTDPITLRDLPPRTQVYIIAQVVTAVLSAQGKAFSSQEYFQLCKEVRELLTREQFR